MVVLAEAIFPNLEYHREQFPAHPSDRTVLCWIIAAFVDIVRMLKNLLGFFKPNTTVWIFPQRFALPLVKLESDPRIV